MSRCHADRKCKKYLERQKIFGQLKIFGALCDVCTASVCRRLRGGERLETEGRQGTRGNILITERILGCRGAGRFMEE